MSFICPEPDCGRSFSSKQRLSLHFTRIHHKKIPREPEDPKTHPYRCSECPRGFTLQRGLSRHLLQTHGIRAKSKSQNEWRYEKRARDPEKYPEKCPFCMFRGFNKHSIRIHISKIHPQKLWLSNPVHIGFKKPERIKNHLRYDDEIAGWLDERTMKNILLQCNGQLNKLSYGQIRKLRDAGLVEKHKRRILTTKGLKLMEELEREEIRL